MQGAREFATMFSTGQIGRLYFRSHYHARGKIFHIYVLPEGESAQPNGTNGPLNKGAVEVYGITGGLPGWTATYGWLHRGAWEQDFAAQVALRRAEIEAHQAHVAQAKADGEAQEANRQAALLAAY